MRKYAILKNPIPLNDYGDMFRRLIVHEMKNGETYIYLSTSIEDDGCSYDNYYEDLNDALSYCEEIGVTEEDLIDIDDTMDGCLDSFIRPVRRRQIGERDYVLEELTDENSWKTIRTYNY